MNTKPNLKAIIDNNLDKTGHIPSKGQSTLPKGGWLDFYKHGGPYTSSWMLTNPKPAPVSFPRMDGGGEEKYKRPISNNTRLAPRQIKGESDAELMDYFLKYKKPYEPSQSVKNIKAGLSAADLATIPFTGNPLGFVVNRGLGALNSVADATTSLLYAKDGQWKNAGIDFGEALLDLVPFRKGKPNPNAYGKGELKLSKLDKSLNKGLLFAKGAAYADDFKDVFPKKANGGDISIPDLNADKWLMKYQDRGEVLLPKIGSAEYYKSFNKLPVTDNLRVVPQKTIEKDKQLEQSIRDSHESVSQYIPSKNPYKKINSTKADIFRSILPVPKNVSQMLSKSLIKDARMSENSLSDDEKIILWNTIQNAKKSGRIDPKTGKPTTGTEYQDYGNQGYGSPDDFNKWFNTGNFPILEGAYNSVTNPGFRLASTIGRGRFWQDEKDPNTMYYTDVYDWNTSEKNFKADNAYKTIRNSLRNTEEKNLNKDKNENYRMNFKLNKAEIDKLKAKKEKDNKDLEIKNSILTAFKNGGWLDEYQVGGEKLLPKIGSKEYYQAADSKRITSDNTRALPAQLTGSRESLAEERKQELAERARKRKDPGTFSKGNYAIEESLRAFPESQGGLGELFDETINPAYFIGRMASNLGNAGSKAYNTGDFSALPGAIAEPLVMGAIGLDPLGSAMKVPGRVAQSMESGVLSNTYKLNPWAFKHNPEAAYRGIGEAGYDDLLSSGELRSLKQKAYPEPYFIKGQEPGSYAKGYMAELNPNEPMKGVGAFKDYHNDLIGTPVNKVTINNPNLKILKKDWLRGYKEVPKSTSSVTNNQKLIFSQPEIVRGPIPNPYPGSTIDVGKIGPNIVSEKIDQSIAPYIGRVEKEYSPAEKVWRSFFKNEAPPYPGSSMDKKKQGGMIIDPRGQWAHPGQNTRIPGNNITMEGVGYPVLAKASNGQQQMMYPGQNYSFPGASYVDEYPMMQRGGWLNKYQIGGMFRNLLPSVINATPTGELMKWATHEPTTSDAAISLADPSGLSNVPFTMQAIRNMVKEPSFGNAADIGWNLLGQVPVFGKALSAPGKVKKAVQAEQNISKAEKLGQAVGKPVRATLKTVDKIVTAPARAVNAGWKAVGVTPSLGAIGANTFNRGQRAWGLGYDATIAGLDKLFPGTPEQKYGGSWLNKYK